MDDKYINNVATIMDMDEDQIKTFKRVYKIVYESLSPFIDE